ncbi:outer membrane protein assembly factor BamE [Ferrimonas balearica]|uniref:outer membrane protein assembly factor BamE n=1 Tax=Ferrimonas balearica TaxID=44012 RepID=UPI001C55B7F1|nr:outer membrane protein assembly factor BamE [Ferrimonas balearica]MBY6017602.1 outer membrane protein assembly factor BamE [Halomonas denitrificans]MBW3139897.1 outer membrane protein assembly factor BamE [Ferrimonas balearica]MBW3164921.1 outer membrane protein assembly factor BamE [Ferrimonas balearica]MBY5980211.1 outer membrane protein assembly factor BamE [Ferrimonas balearica]MBY6093941.1 outer membrane protein assembly factor BamE [Ferrimonas balearica]
MKQFRMLMVAAALSAGVTGCSVFDWMVYKIDIPQGNFIEQNQVEKLRIGMNREQVEFVLGRPVLRDSFASDTWYYVYQFKNGRTNELTRKELVVHFADDAVVSVDGDYTLSDSFNTPLQGGRP